jgi:hypothetical protein
MCIVVQLRRCVGKTRLTIQRSDQREANIGATYDLQERVDLNLIINQTATRVGAGRRTPQGIGCVANAVSSTALIQ